MTLNHVAQCAGSFIESRTLLNAQRFRNGNLHMIDIIAIPQRLEDSISESEDEKVLYRIFSQVMIDAIHLRFVENAEHDLIKAPLRFQVASKRLLDDNARPGFVVDGMGQFSLIQPG